MIGGVDINQIFRMAQQAQEKMEKEMETARVEASTGGGMVRVEMNGKKELLSLKIDPEIVKAEEIDSLQDLVLSAVNDASQQVDKLLSDKLGSMKSGLPGLF